MVGIRMPSEQELPPGPRRDLAVALFDLYELAGKPPVRVISTWIQEDDGDDLPGTLSHEGVSSALRVAAMPRWLNLESLVRVLVKKRRVGLSDADATVAHILTLWRIADGGIPPEPSEDSKLQPEPHEQGIIARLTHPRLGTVEFLDRKTTTEIFREVGGFGDQS
jgi:hypothetical protein